MSMCGRIIVDHEENMSVASGSELAYWISGRAPDGAKSSWNLAPTQAVPVALTSDKDGSRRYELAHWGIIPPWNKDGKPKLTFNARSEELLSKPTFAPSMKAQRCVLPVTGFYEWTGPKGDRTPHAVFGPEKVLPLAGLYRWWKSPDGEWHLTATVLTQASAGVMRALHHRMPVFMADDLLHDWLDPTIVGDQGLLDAALGLSEPYSERLREHAVKPLRGDGPELVLPA